MRIIAKMVLALLLATATMGRAANLTLAWDPSAGATSYNLYLALGTTAFTHGMSSIAGTNVTIGVSTQMVTRYYVTAVNSRGESAPSNTITNTPAPPPLPPLVTLFAPVFVTTNVVSGQTATMTARIQNDGDGPFNIADGSITLLAPGASRATGPYVLAAVISPQVVAAHTAASIAGSWNSTSGASGSWLAYLSVKDAGGTWIAGPGTAFTVSASALPPAPPANLRATSASASQINLFWDAPANASTVVVERESKNVAYSQIASLGSAQVAFIDSGLPSSQWYHYRMRAGNSAGWSSYSTEALARTLNH